MLAALRSLAPFIAALSILLYLAAAVLPCEPPQDFVPPRASVHAGPIEALARAPHEAHTQRASHTPHGAHTQRASHTPHGAHATNTTRASHADHAAHGIHAGRSAGQRRSHHAQDARASREAPPPASMRGDGRVPGIRHAPDGSFAELKRKCVCGCSETRSQVGGGTARLGAVVPGIAVARLAEAEDRPAEDRVRPRPFEVPSELEPIPI